MRQASLLLLLFWTGAGRAQEVHAEDLVGYERLLRDHQLPAKGASLLNFFRERTLTKDQIRELSSKVDRLGDPIYSQRVRAAAELVKAGYLAKPFLTELIKDPQADAEAVRRAELCLRQIAEGNENRLAIASANLIARDKPDQAAMVLVHYLPFATDPGTIEAVQQALNAVGVKAGKAEPVLVKAVRDKSPQIRAGAGEALIRGGGLKNKPLVEHLLADKDVRVRLQLAAALVEKKDKSAVPLLIAALADAPSERAWVAEDLLIRLAGEHSPPVALDGKTPPGMVRAAWEDWWKKNEARVDLDKLSQTEQLLGYTLVTYMVPGVALNGRIKELKPNKEVHWQIDGVRYPVDAQVIGPNRVLIAEYFGNRITERDFKGNVLWEKACTMPVGCQRFPNGETFITTRRNLLLVDRDGKELFTYFPTNGTISAAHRARNGQMILVTTQGLLQVLNPQGKEIRSFQAGQLYSMGSNIEVLPAGRILMPLYRENRIVEYDANGRVAWQANLASPTSVARLPNGHTLVASMSQQRLIEINREGKEVWSLPLEGRPWRVRRR